MYDTLVPQVAAHGTGSYGLLCFAALTLSRLSNWHSLAFGYRSRVFVFLCFLIMATRPEDELKAFLLRKNAPDLQGLCGMAELDISGSKADLVERFMDAGSIKDVDFMTSNMDDMSFSMIFTKAFDLKQPTTGKRSEMQEAIRKHLGLPPPETVDIDEDLEEDPDFTYLKERVLNTSGQKSDWVGRKKIFADFDHNKDFDNMELGLLNTFADLYGLPEFAQGRRSEAVAALKKTITEYGLSFHLKFGDKSKRPCINSTCKKFAENDVCPKTGKLKKACSYECYNEYKRGRDAKRKRTWEETDSDATPEKRKKQGGPLSSKTIKFGGYDGGSNETVELLNTQTQVLMSLMKERGSSSATERDGKSLESQLQKTQPHAVSLLFTGDHERFGLHIARAIDFSKSTDEDLAVVSLHMRLEELKEKTLDLLATEHAQGEREFVALVLKCLLWAGKHEETCGIKDAKVARVKQTMDFNTSFEDMVKQTWLYARSFSDKERFYRTMIRRCAQAAIGTVLSQAAIKSIEKSEKFKADLEARWGGNLFLGNGGHGTLGNGRGPPRETTVASTGGGYRYGQQPSGAEAVRQVTYQGEGGDSGGGYGNRRTGTGKTRPPGQEVSEKTIGAATIVSQHVGGSNMKGARACTSKCGYNNNGKVCQGLHNQFECPRKFADTYPRKAMPGWTYSGERRPGSWNGDEITEACLKEWRDMQRAGWFTRFPFAEGRPALPFEFV